VGALQLSKVCGEVEAIARDHGFVPELAPGIEELRQRLAEAVAALSGLSAARG
jgi:hypothetical protein